MTKKEQAIASKKLSDVIVKGMQEKKAVDIVVMDLRNVKNAVADFFVICSGNSDKQLSAIAQSVDDEVFKTLNEDPWSKEGKHNKEWMLLDYVTVVVHIFKKDKREFFALEELWGDAVVTHIKEIKEVSDYKSVNEPLDIKAPVTLFKEPIAEKENNEDIGFIELKKEVKKAIAVTKVKTNGKDLKVKAPKAVMKVKKTEAEDIKTTKAAKKIKTVKQITTRIAPKKASVVIKALKPKAAKKVKAVKNVTKAKATKKIKRK